MKSWDACSLTRARGACCPRPVSSPADGRSSKAPSPRPRAGRRLAWCSSCVRAARKGEREGRGASSKTEPRTPTRSYTSSRLRKCSRRPPILARRERGRRERPGPPQEHLRTRSPGRLPNGDPKKTAVRHTLCHGNSCMSENGYPSTLRLQHSTPRTNTSRIPPPSLGMARPSAYIGMYL